MILCVIPHWTDDGATAEALLEFIFAQNERQQLKAHVLLVSPPTLDKELAARIRISAELAFSGVYHLELRPLADDRAPKWKATNNCFTQAATHIQKCFRFPFLWLEPDTIPTRKGWFSRLVLEYGSQPKDYFGPRLRIETPGKPDAFLMARTAVYPADAIKDVPAADAPFEIASAVNVFPKFNITKLIQSAVITNESDLAKVRDDAVLVHSDKNGWLRRKLESEKPEESNGVEQPGRNNWFKPSQMNIKHEPELAPEPIMVKVAKKKGRPSRAEIEARNAKLAEVAAA